MSRHFRAIAGSDPADAVTRKADKHKRENAANLDSNSIQGKPAFNTVLAILRHQGAILVDIKKIDGKLVGKNEDFVLQTEFKASLAKCR